jgi:hypothetical protein
MITAIDEVLKKLLIREIDIKGNEIDIQFDAPKREWSSRISKPTLNLFLFDIRKNLRLRGSEQFTTINHEDGTSEVRVNPVRMDLRYLLSAWVKEAEDEHLLLSMALVGLLRNPFLPPNLYPEKLLSQPAPIPVEVGSFTPENGPVDKFSEIWGVLDNEIRPGILVTITVSVDPYKPIIYKQVKTREINFYQDTNIGKSDIKDQPKGIRELSKKYLVTGGTILSTKYDTSSLSVILVEKQLAIPLDEKGNFVLTNIVEGEYHLDILLNTKVLKRQKIQIPAPKLEIQI